MTTTSERPANYCRADGDGFYTEACRGALKTFVGDTAKEGEDYGWQQWVDVGIPSMALYGIVVWPLIPYALIMGNPGLKPGNEASWKDRNDDWTVSLYYWTMIQVQEMTGGINFVKLYYWNMLLGEFDENVVTKSWSETMDFFYMSFNDVTNTLVWDFFTWPIMFIECLFIFLVTFPLYNVKWQFQELTFGY